MNYIKTLTLRGGVDRILQKKQPIYDLREIFHYNSEPIPRLILIMGGSGIGKTTLANEICVKWAKDGFLSDDFNIVVLISLRTVQQRSLEDVVMKLIGEKAYQLLKESLGAKCLIILEGLDEIAAEQQQNDSLLMELVKDVSVEFVKAKIVITSRPNACQGLKANRTIEIMGLGDKEIMEFVQNSFQGNTQSVETFSKQLDEYPQLYSLCYVPLSLVMIVRIFKYKQQSLPSTLTELYRLFVVLTLIREEKRKLNTKCLEFTSKVCAAEEILCEVFADISSEKIKLVFALCKLAYYGFFEWYRQLTYDCRKRIHQKEPKIVFTENDLVQAGIKVTDNCDGYGLLQVESLYQLTGDCVTYNFVHLTVQEFLCAVYMLTLSQKDQCHLLKIYFDDYPNIMKFYCGLTKLDFHQIIYSKLTSPHSTVTVVKCLYEGQWNMSLHKLLSPFVLDTSGIRLLPYDCLCVSYVYCHYPVTKLNLFRCRIGYKNAEILAKWCLNKTTKLQELSFMSSNLTSKEMKHVVKIVTSSPSLRVLDVSGNHIEDDGISYLQPINTLTELKVADCKLSVKGASHIKVMLENNKVQHLDIGGNPIGDDGIRLITEGIQHNNTLTKLDAYSCDFSVEGATYIKKMLMKNKKLQYLDIGGNKIDDDGVRHVTEGLQHNDTLTGLSLCNCEISLRDATYIKKMLMKNRKLQYLDIGHNNIKDDGVRHVTEGLQHNDTLTGLSLCNCEILLRGATSISEMIKINHTLQVLDISSTGIGDEEIAVIAKNFDNARISKLNVSDCYITDTGAESLAAGLKDNRTIKSLDVQDNGDITVDGVVAIFEAAVANGVCQEVEFNDVEYGCSDTDSKIFSISDSDNNSDGDGRYIEYDSEEQLRWLMRNLETRQESNKEYEDNNVTIPLQNRLYNSTVTGHTAKWFAPSYSSSDSASDDKDDQL